jgi:hypothetical protein
MRALFCLLASDRAPIVISMDFGGPCMWHSGRTDLQDKKAVQQGRSGRRPEAYPLGYVEDLSDARTPLADFFSILLEVGVFGNG